LQEPSVEPVAFLVHTQIKVSTPEEVFPPIKRFFFPKKGARAELIRTAQPRNQQSYA
jgi:hypothetical protein